MAIQPITDEEGNVIDEYDDGREALPPDAKGTATPAKQAVASEVNAAQQEGEADGHVESASSQPHSSPPQPAPAAIQKEDATDFDASDVLIQIMLQRADGHPQGRLVSVVIHNFSGQPIIADYREAELTDQARLDSIQRAIYPVMQRFLLELSGRKQKKLEEEAKRAPRLTPQPAQKTVAAQPSSAPPSATPTPSPAPTPKPQISPQAGQNGSGKDGGKKKDNSKQSKYQPIPMF